MKLTFHETQHTTPVTQLFALQSTSNVKTRNTENRLRVAKENEEGTKLLGLRLHR